MGVPLVATQCFVFETQPSSKHAAVTCVCVSFLNFVVLSTCVYCQRPLYPNFPHIHRLPAFEGRHIPSTKGLQRSHSMTGLKVWSQALLLQLAGRKRQARRLRTIFKAYCTLASPTCVNVCV